MNRKPKSRLLLGLLALSQVVCHQAILTAPLDSTISLFANPEFIAANGEVSVISALVVEPAGTPVPDGTVVQFFTTLGRIDEQGKTNDGVARVNLVSDTRSGDAVVRAFSGAAQSEDEVTVKIGSARATNMIVTADPIRIRPNDPRHSRIVATVLDEHGNFAVNVPVFFSVSTGIAPSPSPAPGPSSTEFMRSGGSPIFTDSNGQAVDFLETRHPRDADPKVVTVTAETPIDVTDSVEVVIN
jgi:hypothetical protein